MKKEELLISILLLIFGLMFFIPGIIAPYEETEQEAEQENSAVTSIELFVAGSVIEWNVEGYSKNGFKVVWSKNENPTYPVREKDRYHYYSDPKTNRDTLDAFDGKGEYYVRVCEYLGGKCGIYSNEEKVYLGSEDKDELEEKEDYEEELEDDYSNENETDNELEYEINESEDKISNTISCNGCLVEKVCYPLGFRKEGKYCFDNFEFINQSKEETSCDNNFECESNLCLDNECVSGSLIRKILNWVKGIFD